MGRFFILMCAMVGMAAPDVARADTFDEVTKKIATTMSEWRQLRDLTIEVQEIKGLRGSSSDKEALEARLETLLTKRRSNREWLDYWKQEEQFAQSVAKLYEMMAPLGKANLGKGLAEQRVPALATRKKAAAAAVTSQQTALAQLEADVAAARAWLSKRAESAAKAIADGPQTQTLVAAVAKAKAELAEAEKGRAEATEDDARDKAEKAVKDAQKALAEAQKALATRENLEVMAATQTKAPAAVPEGLEPDVAAKLKTLVDGAKRRATLEESLKEAKAQLETATKTLEGAEEAVKRFRARRPALDDWAQLARDKQANQDVYFKAIDADIRAVEERLAGLEGQPSPEMLNKSEKICAASRSKNETSLEKYYACKESTKQEKGELEQVIGNIRGAIKLNKVQTASIAQLIEAQQRDKELVVRELRIAEEEFTRAKDAAFSTQSWEGMWSDYAARARGKQKALTDALRTSLEVQRGLKVMLGMRQSDLKAKEQRKAEVSARLEKASASSSLFWAVVKTAWEYLRRAYMVPIYLLIAWLLLRLSGRIEKKVVTKARENQSDRDAVQRVETLSTVAKGGFRLVVYIATVLMCLVAIDVDIGPLLGGAAIFGLAISFGSQSLVKDVVTGFFILLEDQFAVGDYISTSGVEGTVEKVTLRRTVLRDLRGVVHTVPNGSITSVSNMSQGWARVVINLGVAYGTDLDKVKAIIDRLGDEFYAEEEWAEALQEPPRYVGMTKFDASSIVFRCMFKTEQLANYGAEREFNRRIHDAFAKEGIEIPYDKMDVNLSAPLPAPGATAGEAQAAPAS